MFFRSGRRRRRAFAARLAQSAAGHDLEPARAARANDQHAPRRYSLDQRRLMRLAGTDSR